MFSMPLPSIIIGIMSGMFIISSLDNKLPSGPTIGRRFMSVGRPCNERFARSP